ncbi:IS5 family transposase [Aeoliella sp. ICT_H6.2]|uniref:IS5 family transposase n=1 Tax=Aeoliella straminimaris TaxID=2954799 RepID=A0A9X2JFX9_9BACT|nr:IS5 family transposase [Aeoliella straminimaris]MCO6042898.1 IS5 family transposase [Aeoliella straminimaris]
MKTECQYSSDSTNKQWQSVRQLLPPPARLGRRPIDRRRIVNAILYLVRTGCQWRMLPQDFPNWNTVYGVFRRWRDDGTWQRIHDRLREKVRKAAGKKSTPTAAIVDSQSIRTAEGGEERGYDAGKKITGRKRHLAVDTLGLVLAVVVHSAAVQDQWGAEWVMDKLGEQFRRLKVIFGDSAYGRSGLPEWVKETFGWMLHTVLRPVDVKGFVVLPKRWIVERTFAWLGRHRRHSKDYEKTEASSEAITYIAMISLMSKRLAMAEK